MDNLRVVNQRHSGFQKTNIMWYNLYVESKWTYWQNRNRLWSPASRLQAQGLASRPQMVPRTKFTSKTEWVPLQSFVIKLCPLAAHSDTIVTKEGGAPELSSFWRKIPGSPSWLSLTSGRGRKSLLLPDESGDLGSVPSFH